MSETIKLRIRFQKTGPMKFIGHLDTMRFFQKLFRLAGLDLKYSEGFSPHPIMSFASPLGVGIESEGEYVDLEVCSVTTSEAMVNALNAHVPEGLLILSCRALPSDAKNAMSLISCADYRIFPKRGGCPITQALIDRIFTDAPEFSVVKKTKKSETTLDLKKYVYDFRVAEDAIFLRLSAGSETNIKPELLLFAFFERAGVPYVPTDWQVRRLDLYAGDAAEGFVSLERFGTEILD